MVEFKLPTSGSAESMKQWCRETNIPDHECRTRFMEFIILGCISANRKLSSSLVFKGGNALRFAYHSPRSTIDLDFTVDSNELSDDGEDIKQTLDSALQWSFRRYHVKAKCQRVKRNPSKPEATRPTYEVKIGYQFQSDRYFVDFENRNVSTVIPIDISFGDLVCEKKPYIPANSDGYGVNICTLEDIVAEKLRSLLQQPIRNRYRYQDVFDLARVSREFTNQLDLIKVKKFFCKKCTIREIEPIRDAFDATVREMAKLNYKNRIMSQAPLDVIPFDEAWKLVLNLVDSLEL